MEGWPARRFHRKEPHLPSMWRNLLSYGSARIAEDFIYPYQKLRHPQGDSGLFNTFSFNILLFSGWSWVAYIARLSNLLVSRELLIKF